MQSRAESKNSGHPRKEEERSHWTLNWFSGCWYKISFLAPEVYCGSAKEGSQRFCSFFFSIGLPHFLQPSRIFQCRYHQNEPCTLGWILICWQHKRQKSHPTAACQKHALNVDPTPNHKNEIRTQPFLCVNVRNTLSSLMREHSQLRAGSLQLRVGVWRDAFSKSVTPRRHGASSVRRISKSFMTVICKIVR